MKRRKAQLKTVYNEPIKRARNGIRSFQKNDVTKLSHIMAVAVAEVDYTLFSAPRPVDDTGILAAPDCLSGEFKLVLFNGFH